MDVALKDAEKGGGSEQGDKAQCWPCCCFVNERYNHWCWFFDCGPQPTKGCCTLEPEERPDFSVWEKEDLWGMIVPAVFLVIAGLCSLVWLMYPNTFHVIRPPPLADFLAQGLAAPLAITAMYYPLGCLVWYKGVSVAMTRKVSHVLVMTSMPLVAELNNHGEGLQRDIFLSVVWQTINTSWPISLIFLKPVRKRVEIMRLAFACPDRSEDRPYALLWIILQASAMTAVQVPMIQWMLASDKGLLIFIPFLSVGFGDGLAEPVGRIWGKHKYEVTAIGTNKKFTRSYEGSACVFFFTLLAVLIGLPEMNWLQATLSILLIPIANTIVEAKSPHTFDNHLMWGITWILLWLIFDVMPSVSG